MPLKFSTTDKASQHGVKMLVYGGAGAGKTTLCATAPAPIILSAESGLLSLRSVSIDVISIETIDDLREAYDWLTRSQEATKYQTVCLDSISEIAEVVLDHAKRQVKDPRAAYGELIEKMNMSVRAFRDLPGKHVYMAAKLEPVKDEMSGITRYGPSMPGSKLGNGLPYYFDEVFYLGVGKDTDNNDYRYFRTALDLQYVAKDRSGSLDAIEVPDLNHVINKIIGVK